MPGSGLTLEMCRGINLIPAFQAHVVCWQGEVSRCVRLCRDRWAGAARGEVGRCVRLCAGAGGQQKEAESRPQGGAERQMGTSVEVKTYSWEFKRPRTLYSMRTWVIQGAETV